MYLQLIRIAKQTVPRSLVSTELGNKVSVTVKDFENSPKPDRNKSTVIFMVLP